MAAREYCPFGGGGGICSLCCIDTTSMYLHMYVLTSPLLPRVGRYVPNLK